jgi:hypothetical protein
MAEPQVKQGEKKQRKQPAWMEPLSKPELMPEDLQTNADMTADEKMEVWRKRLYAKAVQNAARAAEHAIAVRTRKDEDHRKIVAGGVLEAESAENKQFAAMAVDALKRRVRSDEQFLFPKLFPGAKRPERGPKPKAASASAGKKAQGATV